MPNTPQHPDTPPPFDDAAPAQNGLSLQQLVQQRMAQPDAPPLPAPPMKSGIQQRPTFNIAAAKAPPSALAPNGNQLNAIDTEWAAGIEQMLPTPIFRLRVMKERLIREGAELDNELAHYLALPTPSARKQAQQIRQKLYTLRRHETKVDAQLAALFTQRTVGFSWVARWQYLTGWFTRSTNTTAQWINPLYWLHRLDPTRKAMANANKKLQHIAQLTEKRLTDPTTTAQELADILTTYDNLTARITQLEDQLANASLWEQWTRILR